MTVSRNACACLLALLPLPLVAQQPAGPSETAEEFVSKLGARSGTIVIRDGLATIEVPETFRYIGPEAARRLLSEGWGNPPEASEGVLGMLYPAAVSPLDSASWGVIISYDEDGYVDDAGAEAIDYTKLLKQMQDDAASGNDERRKKGYATVELVGWAAPPRYSAETHKLYWAKELAFSDAPGHTLNYNVRVLGRRGVLVLNAVAAMPALPQIEQSMQTVIGFVDFNEGHRYQDFVKGTDKKAAYGIAGLVAGAIAMKAGFFKLLWVGILAFKKLIIAGIAAASIALRRLFGKHKPAAATPPPAP
jgi:uncharacterized membrane-anchored protein